MGIVYEARDRQSEMRVALKTLRKLEATNLYRFKREFRAVSDLSHPNIVSLYELVAAGGQWFFTMEVVRGGTIIEYVRPGQQEPDPVTPSVARLELGSSGDGDTGQGAPRPAPAQDEASVDRAMDDERPDVTEIADVGRLRQAFGQLAQALHALHQTGLVHRDLKPSNVRVTGRGRVVLMDFGIVAEACEPGSQKRLTHTAGTPAYMAPEQATGRGADRPGRLVRLWRHVVLRPGPPPALFRPGARDLVRQAAQKALSSVRRGAQRPR